MGAPKGSKNAKGNKGGGRKSAYQEMADATFLWNAFIEKHTKEEVMEMLKGKYSIKDVWIAKAYGGNEKFIQQIVNKLFADKQNVSFDVDKESIKELTEFFKAMATPKNADS